MEELKSRNFMTKDTMVFGCGVHNKTEQGYRRGVSLDQSDIQLKEPEIRLATPFVKQAETSK